MERPLGRDISDLFAAHVEDGDGVSPRSSYVIKWLAPGTCDTACESFCSAHATTRLCTNDSLISQKILLQVILSIL